MHLASLGLSASHIRFAVRMLGCIASGQPVTCPYCGSRSAAVLGRKKLLLQLRECGECGLRYRYPKDEPTAARRYYELHYEGGAATELPEAAALNNARSQNFAGSPWDFSDKVDMVRKLHDGPRLLDFGCSWGYAVRQFVESGYDAVGFELSRPRSEFGRHHLGVTIHDEYAALETLPGGSFDVIFTHHVLEHVPSLQPVFSMFSRLLDPEGVLVAFVPNGDSPAARAQGAGVISQEHVTALTARFFSRNLGAYGLEPMFASNPYTGGCGRYLDDEQAFRSLQGEELMVVARRHWTGLHGSPC